MDIDFDNRDIDFDNICKIDQWLDDNVSQEYKDMPLAQDWARVSKVAEELGEAIAELILLTGQNPRKPMSYDEEKLREELADCALTAILALQHFTKNSLKTKAVLRARAERIRSRIFSDPRNVLTRSQITPKRDDKSGTIDDT